MLVIAAVAPVDARDMCNVDVVENLPSPAIPGAQAVHIDLDRFVHGPRWTRCRAGGH
jgi:hypothetical protein